MVAGEKIFKVLLPYIWVSQPYWPCDKHYVDDFLLTCTYKLTFKDLDENDPVVSKKASLISICK